MTVLRLCAQRDGEPVKQDWTITIKCVESEGGTGCTWPWYRAHDVESLITSHLLHDGDIRDLKVIKISAAEDGGRYV